MCLMATPKPSASLRFFSSARVSASFSDLADLPAFGGWPERDPRNFFNRNLDYFFTTLSANGEIHGMGTAYATILYQIFKDAAMNPREFEVMFSMHLPRLTSSSDFRSAKAIWMNISDTKYAGKYTGMIKGYFEKMGVL